MLTQALDGVITDGTRHHMTKGHMRESLLLNDRIPDGIQVSSRKESGDGYLGGEITGGQTPMVLIRAFCFNL